MLKSKENKLILILLIVLLLVTLFSSLDINTVLGNMASPLPHSALNFLLM